MHLRRQFPTLSRFPAIGILAFCAACSESPSPPASDATRELRGLFQADQNEPYPIGEPQDSAARVAFFTAHWNQHFKPRHDRVLALIQADRLVSGEDYFLAGMILNHGITAEDNLVAHALLTIAAIKGHPEARWASAAALDNYLAMKGEAQLFGTVYGGHRQVVAVPMTDALRRQFCVPAFATQPDLAALLVAGRRDEFDRRKVSCPRGIQ
jgi:hypothetical protein